MKILMALGLLLLSLNSFACEDVATDSSSRIIGKSDVGSTTTSADEGNSSQSSSQ